MLEAHLTRHLSCYPSVVIRAMSISDIKVLSIQFLLKITDKFCYKISRKLVKSLKKTKKKKKILKL